MFSAKISNTKIAITNATYITSITAANNITDDSKKINAFVIRPTIDITDLSLAFNEITPKLKPLNDIIGEKIITIAIEAKLP